jgi:hypothetical protein
MTEAEWLAGADPGPMLEFLRGNVSDRKLRLFTCSCVRRVWHLLPDKHCRRALLTAERYADGELSGEKLRYAWGDARRAAQVQHRLERDTAAGTAMWAVSESCEAEIGRVLRAVTLAARCEAYREDSPIDPSLLSGAQKGQVSLLRDIFGNPFRPVTADPHWLTSTVVDLARTMYEARDFAAMPILADALQDAGCEDADILAHCRGGPHVRGCWVVDLVLGKS